MPAAPGAFDGRARSFRERQIDRRRSRRERAVDVLAVGIVLLAVYAVATARPYSSPQTSVPKSGPSVGVNFGTPSVTTLACTAGGIAYAESIPWVGSSRPVNTGQVVVHVSEIWDGDYIPDSGAVANATPSNLCAGAAPASKTAWYVVLQAPNGTNLLTFTVAQEWVSLSHGTADILVENGSALILLTYQSLAGTGRGLSVVGEANGSVIRGVTPL